MTGAGRGIGAATAARLALSGFTVLAAARTELELAKLTAAHPGVIAVPTDVSQQSQVESLADKAAERGRLRAWVNNAAVVDKVAFADLTWERWRAVLATDLDGVFFGCSAAFRRMRGEGGVIVNVASLSGISGVEKFPGLAAYNAAKAGVIALTEGVAVEGREHGIACICLSPGAVATEMLHAAAPHLRPGMTPADVAAIIAWLTTPEAAFLSGTNIPIFSNA